MDEELKRQIPSFDEMFVFVLRALILLGGLAKLEHLDQKAIELMQLPKALEKFPHNAKRNRTEVEYRLAWARTYLKKYGLIENPYRGIWKLSDSFDGNVESIDPRLIVQTVRQWNLDTFKNANISNIEAVSAFERFALAALRDHVTTCGKTILYSIRVGHIIYNAVLPDGFEGENRKTYVRVKNKLNFGNNVDDLSPFLAELKENECFLLALGESLSEADKQGILERLKRIGKCSCFVWDYNDLVNKMSHEPDYIGYLDSPKKTLVEEAILLPPDEKEQRQTKKERIERLKEAYQNQNVFLFLGAGVSIDAGIPLWGDLIRRLLISMIDQKTDKKKLSQREMETLNRLAYANQEDSPLTQVRYIRTSFEDDEYYALVRKILYEKKVSINTGLLNAVGKLVKPERDHIGVKGAVTYNFDDLLERMLRAKEIKYNVVCRETDIPSTNSLNVYHVHGFLPQHADENVDSDMTLIFSEEDYHKVYRDPYCWSNITQLNAFRDSTCLFVGCSLSDPNLRRLLDIPTRGSESPRHFAIMRRKKIEGPLEDKKILNLYQKIDNNIRERFFQSLGVDVIWVDDFKEVPKILTSLIRK